MRKLSLFCIRLLASVMIVGCVMNPTAVSAEKPPLTDAQSGFTANLPPALCACLGEEKPEGKLTVSLPVTDDKHQITEEILVETGAGL